MTGRPVDCIIPDSAQIADGVTLGPRVVLAGEGIVLRHNARLDSAARLVAFDPPVLILGRAAYLGQVAIIGRIGAQGMHITCILGPDQAQDQVRAFDPGEVFGNHQNL